MEMTKETKEKLIRIGIFWARLIAWIGLAIVAPVAYIAKEYGLFKSNDTKSFSGWGLVGILIAFAMVIVALKTIIAGLPKGHIAKQCVQGAIPILVLVCVLFALKSLEKSFSEIEHLLVFLIIVEGIAVPMNPLPKWAFDHNIELFTGKAAEAMKNALGAFFTKKK